VTQQTTAQEDWLNGGRLQLVAELVELDARCLADLFEPASAWPLAGCGAVACACAVFAHAHFPTVTKSPAIERTDPPRSGTSRRNSHDSASLRRELPKKHAAAVRPTCRSNGEACQERQSDGDYRTI
jgi:hypothetical protein